MKLPEEIKKPVIEAIREAAKDVNISADDYQKFEKAFINAMETYTVEQAEEFYHEYEESKKRKAATTSKENE